MWLKDKINSLIINLKSDKMAKQEAILFKQKTANNHREIAEQFTKLESFIEGHEQIPESNKDKIKAVVQGYSERTGEKINHLTNVALMSTAVNWTNKYIESLTN